MNHEGAADFAGDDTGASERCCRTVVAGWLAMEPVHRSARQLSRWTGARCCDDHDDAYRDDAATINMVIVDASMRGRGLGRKMMEEALARAGTRTCYLVATQEGSWTEEDFPFTKAWALPRLARSYSIKARHAMLTYRTTYSGARVAITHASWRSITWHMATSAQP